MGRLGVYSIEAPVRCLSWSTLGYPGCLQLGPTVARRRISEDYEEAAASASVGEGRARTQEPG